MYNICNIKYQFINIKYIRNDQLRLLISYIFNKFNIGISRIEYIYYIDIEWLPLVDKHFTANRYLYSNSKTYINILEKRLIYRYYWKSRLISYKNKTYNVEIYPLNFVKFC